MNNAENVVKQLTFSEPNEVDHYLSHLDLTQDELGLILSKALSYRLSATSDDTRNAGGTRFYQEAIRSARDTLKHKGFKSLYKQGLELTENGKIAIYVCSGNEHTGIVNAYPQSKNAKGRWTLDVLGLSLDNNLNQIQLDYEDNQISFNFPAIDEKNDEENKLEIWCLLHYAYQVNEFQWEVKAELSKATTYDSKNFINGFSTRLILNTKPIDPITNLGMEPEFTPEIDIDILKTG
ncbi:Uncharacterised protein [Providencia rustigianii]|uniref:Uncharacterized protein n=1 Tax=Providencia rustigianii TaxID=158850 RepID=A0A379G5K6_9GAMM|nr:hypothetical protein [Providencia rustigianii]SUC36237.1 Uncharacterised protein [Providencia rustigianii]